MAIATLPFASFTSCAPAPAPIGGAGRAHIRVTMSALLAAPLVAATASSDTGAVRSFDGWIAACDNENVCTAVHPFDAVAGAGESAFVPVLELRHHPFRDAQPEVFVHDPATSAPAALQRPAATVLTMRLPRSPQAGIAVFASLPMAQDRSYARPATYRFRDEDAWSILSALRRAYRIEREAGPAYTVLDPRGLDQALVLFDTAQDLDGTPGALVLKPDGVLDDYAHPVPPAAGQYRLARFTNPQFDRWFADYRAGHPGIVIKHLAEPARGTVTTVRYAALSHDCGVRERWGHIGAGEFVLAERREMPVCRGISETVWPRSFRADTISPDN